MINTIPLLQRSGDTFSSKSEGSETEPTEWSNNEETWSLYTDTYFHRTTGCPLAKQIHVSIARGMLRNLLFYSNIRWLIMNENPWWFILLPRLALSASTFGFSLSRSIASLVRSILSTLDTRLRMLASLRMLQLRCLICCWDHGYRCCQYRRPQLFSAALTDRQDVTATVTCNSGGSSDSGLRWLA